MSATVQRTSRSGTRSLLFHDLASPISAHGGKFTSPGQAAAVSALWRENFGGADPPPPPIFTLEDRAEFSPEAGMADYSISPATKSEMRTPVWDSCRDSLSPLKSKPEATASYALMGGQQIQQTPTSSSWWSPIKSGSEHDEKGKGSPVEGVVQPGALITLPPPREVAKPELQNNSLAAGNLDEEEWVTVYGFSPGDTNLVLREFEKCGVILKHVPGPGDANWIHILYQVTKGTLSSKRRQRQLIKRRKTKNRSDAQKALNKNGLQINGVLIIGVKPLDPIQRQALNERLNNQGFMTLPPPSSRSSELILSRVSSGPYYVQNHDSNTQRSVSAIASPAKSVVSKVMDLMFGI